MRLTDALIACCLLAATSGCLLQRPPDGSIFSNPWLQASDHAPWLKFRSATATATDADSYAAEKGGSTADKPELLPWRSRLKSYRLGTRLARGQESTSNPDSSEIAATPGETRPPLEAPPVPTPATPDDTRANGGRVPATETAKLQLPASVGLRPESNRPDFVVD